MMKTAAVLAMLVQCALAHGVHPSIPYAPILGSILEHKHFFLYPSIINAVDNLFGDLPNKPLLPSVLPQYLGSIPAIHRKETAEVIDALLHNPALDLLDPFSAAAPTPAPAPAPAEEALATAGAPDAKDIAEAAPAAAPIAAPAATPETPLQMADVPAFPSFRSLIKVGGVDAPAGGPVATPAAAPIVTP